MTLLEKELVRLEIQKQKRMTEAVVAFQYKDHERSLWAQNEAGKLCGQMAKVRREGVKLPNKNKERRFLAELNSLYGECVELF